MPGTRIGEDGFTEAADRTLDTHTGTNIASPFTPNGLTWTGIDAAGRAEVVGGAGTARTNATAGAYKTNLVPTDADYTVNAVLPIHDFNNYFLPGIRCSGTSSATNNGYYLTVTASVFLLFRCVNNAFVSIGSWTHGLTAPTSLPIELSAIGSVIKLLADTGSGLVTRISYNDPTPVVGPGAPGARGGGTVTGDTLGVQLSQYFATNFLAASISVSPTSLLESASPTVVNFTSVGSQYTVTPPSMSVTGGTGSSISGVTVLTDTTFTASVIPGTTGGLLTFTDATIAQSCTMNVVNILATDANIIPTPYTVAILGGAMVVINNGGGYKVPFTGTSIQMVVNTTILAANAISAPNYPIFEYTVDGVPWLSHTLTASDNAIAIASGLASGNHVLKAILKQVDTAVDRYNSTPPINSWITTGFIVDNGATTYPLTPKPNNLLVQGDSITEGINSPSYGLTDSYQSYVTILAQDLNAEVGQCGFSGQGWQYNAGAAGGNVPDFWTPGTPAAQTPFNYWLGITRLMAGKFNPVPTYYVLNLGTNDGIFAPGNIGNVQTAIEDFLPHLRSALNTNTWAFIVVPFGQWIEGTIFAAFNAYQLLTPDPYMKFINLGASAATGLTSTASLQAADGIHPNVITHGILGSLLSNQIQAIVNPSNQLTVVNSAGNALLTWTGDPIALSYNVLRSSVVGGPYTVLVNLTAGTLTYTDTTASGNEVYSLQSLH